MEIGRILSHVYWLPLFFRIAAKKESQQEVDHLNSTQNREADKTTHGAANVHDNTGESHLDILLDLVVGGRLQVDLDELKVYVAILF